MARHIFQKTMIGLAVAGLVMSMIGCTQTDSNEKDSSSVSQIQTEYDKETNSLSTWEQELGAEQLRTISSAAVRGMQVTKNGNVICAISYEPRTYKNSYDCWSFSVPYESWVSVDTEAMYEYFAHLETLNLEKTDVSEEEAGLTENTDNSIFVAYYSQQEEENAGQAEPDEGITYWIGNEADGEHYYVKTSCGNEIWTADKAAVDGLLEPETYDMILKVANLVSIETVSSVDIEIDGENYTMDLSDQENGNYKLNGTKADKEEVSSLYTELISIFIEKEIEDQNAERDTTEPIMTFTFHRNIEEAPDIVESFYKYEKDYAAVNINGTEFFLADIASVNDLADTIEEAFK